MRLAERAFHASDQIRFAAITGDRNPMHVDALQARRTQAGAPVVHGMHMLLWALDAFAAAHPGSPPLRACDAQFYSFVYLDEVVRLDYHEAGRGGPQLTVDCGNSRTSRVTLKFGEPLQQMAGCSIVSAELAPIVDTPLHLEFEQMAGQSGRFPLAMTQEDATALFPHATRWIGASRIRALAATSYLVGMVCPGLNSIYRELSIECSRESMLEKHCSYRVAKTDRRFRLVEMEVSGGGLTGTVKSFARMPPVRQASLESLKGVVGAAEFADSVALIVGGSRGLGELTAKLIAAGGGHAIVTWQTGRDDAERVAGEIRAGGRQCDTLAYDARKPTGEQLASLKDAPTHAYYFATPAIFKPPLEVFSRERFREFLAIYVDGFWELSQALRARQAKLSLFYPSSVAVTERPRGMTEYAMAKAAGELLCADLSISLAPMRVVVKRLPRLPTDQTASNTAAEGADPLSTMLPIIREVQVWPS